MKKYSLTWVHNEPSPNQMEFFQALAKHPDVKLRVLSFSATFTRRPFSLGDPWIEEKEYLFDFKVMKGFNIPLGKHRECYVNPGILREVFASPRNELWLVGGYTVPTVQLAMWALNFRRMPWILVNEPPLRFSPFRNFVRDRLMGPARRGAKGLLSYGSRRRAEFFHRVLPPERVIATSQYQNLAPLASIERDPARWEQPGVMRFFYAGRLETYSGVDVVVRCFNRLAELFPDVELEILGHGSQREALERLVSAKARPRVTFHGAVPRQDVPGIFAHGDIFVHANHRQGWGMVVNEALAAGMPVIASREIGAAEDLIEDGVNGFLLEDPKDEEGFFAKMKWFAQNRDRMPEFIQAARRTADKLSLECGVQEFLSVIDRLMSSAPAPARGGAASTAGAGA